MFETTNKDHCNNLFLPNYLNYITLKTLAACLPPSLPQVANESTEIFVAIHEPFYLLPRPAFK